MTTGFSTTTETKMQASKNYLKQISRSVDLSLAVNEGKRNTRKTRYESTCDKSRMFNPAGMEGSKKKQVFSKDVTYYYNGIWYLRKYQCERYDTFDIGICVPSADGAWDLDYNPLVIKNRITEDLGSDVYEQWRVFANSRMDDLKELLQFVRDDIDSISSSVWSCKKSKNLVKRLGMPVIGDHTFLMPSRFAR